MKFFLKSLLKILMLVTLFCIQICLIKYEHNPNLNILVIFYNYMLFNHISIISCAILLLMIDGINFLMTGCFGFITITIALFSMFALKYDNHFYNKLIMPIISIILFSCIQNIMLFQTLAYPYTILDFFITTTVNSIILILFWIITKRPIHT